MFNSFGVLLIKQNYLYLNKMKQLLSSPHEQYCAAFAGDIGNLPEHA